MNLAPHGGFSRIVPMVDTWTRWLGAKPRTIAASFQAPHQALSCEV
jgi:hypothetical protein